MEKKIMIVIGILLFLSIHIYGQERKLPLNIQSPNAVALGEFGNNSINYYRGTPNIQVPIHTLKAYEKKLNIYLSYDASGIRVDQHPGWVGQNWSLQAGGVITRSVKCRADEYCNSESGLSPVNNHFRSVQIFKNLNPLNISDAKEIATSKVFSKSNLDLEPDVFRFNFMGITGEFYYGTDKKWKVSSESNVEVIFDVENYNNYSYPQVAPDGIPNQDYNNKPEGQKYDETIKGFKLRDELGTIYEFGYKEHSIEYSLPFFEQLYKPLGQDFGAEWTANAWYLTKVIDKYGNVLFDLEYTRGYWIAAFYNVYQDKVTTGYTERGSLGFIPVPVPGTKCEKPENIHCVDGSLISPVYVSSIKSIHGELITFDKSLSKQLSYDFSKLYEKNDQLKKVWGGQSVNYYYYTQSKNKYASPNGLPGVQNPIASLGWCKLDAINIYTNDDKIKYIFNYNNNEKERLFLNGIDIASLKANSHTIIDEDKYAAYQFRYNSPELLPEYLSKKVDHWGYYKGTEYIIDKTNFTNHYVSRESDGNYLKFGMLNQIIYPTGGYSRYEYEPHDYSVYVSNDHQSLIPMNGIAGGLRIKKIEDFNGEHSIIRNFTYLKNNSDTKSSGILNGKPQYYWEDWKTGYEGDGYQHQKVFSINSIVPLSNSFEYHIGYSDVQEYKVDGSSMHYSYIDYADIIDQIAPISFNTMGSPYEPISSLGFARGKLKSLKYFNQSNDIVKEKINTYRSLDEVKNNFIVSFNGTLNYKCKDPSNDHKYFAGNVVKIFYKDYDLISTTTIDYLDDKEVISLISYNRDDYDDASRNFRFLREITEIKGQNIIKTSFKYPKDKKGVLYMDELIAKGRLGEIVETYKKRNQVLLETTKINYKKENNLLLKDSVRTFNNKGDEIAYMTYKRHDREGNVVEFEGADGVNTLLIYGYKKRYPIAIIKNGVYDKVKSFIDQNQKYFDDLRLTEVFLNEKMGELRNTLNSAQLICYAYKPGIGISSITDPNGIITYYKYDKFNRLESVSDFDKNIIKNHKYNYGGEKFNANVTFKSNTNYYKGEKVELSVQAEAGSGDYLYSWKLCDNDRVLQSNINSSTFVASLVVTGTLTVKCEITDNVTKKKIIRQLSFDVKDYPVKFVNIVNSSSGGYLKGIVNTRPKSTVKFRLYSLVPSNTVFYINGESYSFSYYGSKEIEVISNQEGRIYVEVRGITSGYAEVTIEEVNVGTISTPFKLSSRD